MAGFSPNDPCGRGLAMADIALAALGGRVAVDAYGSTLVVLSLARTKKSWSTQPSTLADILRGPRRENRDSFHLWGRTRRPRRASRWRPPGGPGLSPLWLTPPPPEWRKNYVHVSGGSLLGSRPERGAGDRGVDRRASRVGGSIGAKRDACPGFPNNASGAPRGGRAGVWGPRKRVGAAEGRPGGGPLGTFRVVCEAAGRFPA